ncbi:hypothetical protein NC653_040403 [Populus alba x Populus x berolinensis]|uniref:Uncharacterized protein n=1 Tax=Populus alba x Populus x berolinensis TaxID=444605 RepID=A0AAD6PRQ7_9ROSI|nr:hypothetical protein NC653_040400 [Populus alba x Populus x berolinensis]KAJ6958750.1 hypothetical protein NC653_040401 [Populus alba x Populus x berolinensis]KAJ6958753.1 hypothetical protein NC653_040403 [Populus alba x Populus x berolinensis]
MLLSSMVNGKSFSQEQFTIRVARLRYQKHYFSI